MRGLVLAAMMFGTACAARAADMPDFLRGTIPAQPTVTRNWAGWYVGGQADYSATDMNSQSSLVGLTSFIFRNTVLEEPTSQLTTLGKVAPHGTGFGGFVGRNYQWDDVILGVEANYNYFSNLKGTSASSIGPLQYSFPPGQFTPANDTPTFTVALKGSASAQIKDEMTFRGRAGWAVGDFLPYAFGGVAVGRMDIARSVTSTTNRRDDITSTDLFGNTVTTIGQTFPVPSQSTTMSQERTNAFVFGLTAGLGMEYALWNCLFLRGEWEYIKFLSVMNTSINMNSARFGVGYKF